MSPDFAGLFGALRPEASLVLGALAVLGLDLSVFRRRAPEARLRLALGVGILAVLAAAAWAAAGARGPAIRRSTWRSCCWRRPASC